MQQQQATAAVIVRPDFRGRTRERLKTIRRTGRQNPTMVAGIVFVLLMGIVAVSAPLLTTYDPQAIKPADRFIFPSAENWFGTDLVGRDLYAWTLYAGRVSLTIGLSVAFLTMAFGSALGIVAGFFRPVDAILMRFMDGLMSIPSILLAIALMTMLGASIQNVIIALVIVDTPPRADRAAYLVAEAVDFSLIPCRPGPMDLRALNRTVDIIDLLNAPAGIVLNAVPPPRGDQEVSITRRARESISRFNLPVAPTAITQRDTLAHPMPDGRAYIELYPDGKPSQEIGRLWRWVAAQLTPDRHERDDELHPGTPAPPAGQPSV